MTAISSLRWDGAALIILDQRKLPLTVSYLSCRSWKEVASAIGTLAVRGAPAIGVAAAYGVVLAYRESLGTGERQDQIFREYCQALRKARPTAVNLSWAVDSMMRVYDSSSQGFREAALLRKARSIEQEDQETCRKIGEAGAALFQGKTNLRILTHCNTGALATAGIGTAFGVISTLHERGQIGCVYADETRPLLQGSRLTAFELMAGHIPCRLITDNMAAFVMKNEKIDAVITGADRIAANGDTANKIGTYGLAVLAAYHHVPFYIAAPFSTFDFSIADGNTIVIEERGADEVRSIGGIYTAPKDVPVYNPAFDVTPHQLIHGIITEKGVLQAPYEETISQYERSLHE